MSEMSAPYRRIYFDSNLLIKANWPRLSQTMRTALNTASHLSIPVVLLQSVERELKAHCLRNLFQTRADMIRNAEALSSLCKPFGTKVSMSLPSEDRLQDVYEKAVDENVIEFNLLRSSPTLRLTEELFEMAIQKKKPFGDKGRNFQDAVICLAAIDDLVSSLGQVGALVSRDNIFEQQVLDDLCQSQGVTMSLFKSEVALNDDMRTFLKQQAAREWLDDEELARGAVNENLPVLQKFIDANLEVPARVGFTNRILSINRIDLVKISRVETPSPWDRPPGEPVTITAQILIHLHATVRRPSSSSLQTEVLKVGLSPRPTLASRIAAPLYTEREEVLERTVNVELKARLNEGRYVNLEPLAVAIGTARSDASLAVGFGMPPIRLGT
jgi:predicted nucleic acid-binding protein